MASKALPRTLVVVALVVVTVLTVMILDSDSRSDLRPAERPIVSDRADASIRIDREGVPGAAGDAEPSRLAPSGPGILTIQVLSSSGGRVAGARISGSASDRLLAVTDLEGCAFVRDLDPIEALTVDATGFRSRTIERERLEAAHRAQRTEVCRLDAAPTISGTVRWSDGTPGPAGLLVVAWADDSPPEPEQVAAVGEVLASGAEPTMEPGGVPTHPLVTRTGDGGRFHLPVPDAGARYVVTAAGDGLVAERRVLATPGSGTSAALGIACVYALGVRLVSATNGTDLPPLTTVESADSAYGVHDSGLSGVSLQSPPPLERYLLDPLLEDRSTGLAVVTLMSRVSRPSVGPVRFIARYPGMETSRSELMLPLLEDQLAVHSIGLTESVGSEGACSVNLTGWDEFLGTSAGSSHLVTLAFRRSRDDGMKRHELLIVDPRRVSDERIVVHGIPHGEYRVQLQAGMTKVWASTEVSIGASPASITFDLAERRREAGALEIELFDRSGEPFGGRAYFEVRHLDGAGSDFSFECAPYRIGFLPPGDYEVVLSHAFAGEGDYPSARSNACLIRPGETTHVPLVFGQG